MDDASSSLKSLLATLNQLANPAIVARLVVKYIRNYLNTKRRSQDD